MIKSWQICTVFLCIPFASCSSTPHVPVYPVYEKSPRYVMIQYYTALAKGDRRELAAVVRGSQNSLAMLYQAADVYHATSVFRKKIMDVYGEEAWQTFQNKREGGKSVNIRIPGILQKEDVMSLPVIYEERIAFMQSPFENKWRKFVNEGGQWYLDLESLNNEELKIFGDMSSKLVKAMEKVSQRIGKEGVTPNGLAEQLVDEVFNPRD